MMKVIIRVLMVMIWIKDSISNDDKAEVNNDNSYVDKDSNNDKITM